MKTFVVFEPAGGILHEAAAERVVILREKFSWPALFFTPLWLLWHRLWLGFLGWLVALSAIAVIVAVVDLHVRAAVPALLLPTFVVAFEAAELRRRKLLRAGMQETKVIVADDLEAAERRFFSDWTKGSEAKAAAPASPRPLTQPSASASPNSIVGLFPEPGTRR